MATIVTRTGPEERPDNDPRVMAYTALARASERMAEASGRAQLAYHLARRRKRSTFRFRPSESLLNIVDAMPRVLAGEITPEAGMALLWRYDSLRERLAV